MVKQLTKKAVSAVDKALLQRIAELSRDTAPEVFPRATVHDDTELNQRRQAESQFQYALARRTWMRLSPEERVKIRERVLERDSFFREKMYVSGFEYACHDEVQTLIRQGRTV